MKPEEIMNKAQELYSGADTISSLTGARAAAKSAASLIFYLAKLHLSPQHEAKKVTLKRKRI
jgi:hypothetical protein